MVDLRFSQACFDHGVRVNGPLRWRHCQSAGRHAVCLLLAATVVGCGGTEDGAAQRTAAIRRTVSESSQENASSQPSPPASPAIDATPNQLSASSPADSARQTKNHINTATKPVGAEKFAAETFSTAAGKQLKRLAQSVLNEGGRLSSESIATLIVDSFDATRLRPDAPKIIHRGPDFEVRRTTSPVMTMEHAGHDGLRQALLEMLEPLEGAAPNRFSFHIVDAQLTEPAVTRVHVELSGRTATTRMQQDSHWLVAWKRDDQASRPKILTIELTDYEETVVHRRDAWFRDATPTILSGHDFFDRQLAFSNTHWRKRIERHHIIDKSGHHGLSIGDVNGDGLEDVYVCQPGGLPNRLLTQNADGSISDVSKKSGTDFLDNTRSALILDFNNDGTQDLILATVSAVVFLANDGTGSFRLVNNITSIVDAYSMTAADYDNDGDLDIFACRYHQADADPLALPIPTPYFDAQNGGKNYLIKNEGNWRTSNATELSGLSQNNNRFSYAAIWIDYDKDGDQDLYVVNDFGRNNLYHNNLIERGAPASFEDVAMTIGMRDGAFGMSASAADYDRDGWEDIYVGNMYSSAGSRISRMPDFKPEIEAEQRALYRHLARGNTLFQNQAGREFQDVSVDTGITMGRWSWGSVFVDINNDGWQDLVVANGYITGDRAKDDL